MSDSLSLLGACNSHKYFKSLLLNFLVHNHTLRAYFCKIFQKSPGRKNFFVLGPDPDPDVFQKWDPDPAPTVRIRNAGKDDSHVLLTFTFIGSVADPDDSDADPDPTPEKPDPDPAPCKVYITLCNKKFSHKNGP
jgi:hypothetical protein